MRSNALAKLELSDRINPADTALIVVDVQNDFVSPDGACGKAGDDLSAAPPMIERLRKLIASARKAGIFIVYIQTVYDEPVLSPPLAEQYLRRGFTNGICLTDTAGVQFVDGIGPNGSPSEVAVKKYRYSAFWGSTIDLLLRSNGIKNVVMTGIATDICVESTARDAFFRDYRIVEAPDCMSTFFQDRHDASLVVMGRSFGVTAPSTQIAEVWDKATPGLRGWQPEVKAKNAFATLEQRIDPAHSALILIDMQNDFCDDRGAAVAQGGSINAIKKAASQARALLASARAQNTLVIHVTSEYGQSVRNVGSPLLFPSATARDGAAWSAYAARDLELMSNNVEVCQPGTWGAQFLEGFEPLGNEPVVVKHRFSGFVDTRLDLLLRSNGIRTVLVAGVTTNCGIESTVRDASSRDYEVVVADDCVAAKDAQSDLHDSSLETMRSLFGAVEPSKRIIDAWHAAAPVQQHAVA